MPTIQSLMTRRVSESEQGQLQGANNSVGSIAGILSPLFFGTVYSLSVGARPMLPFIGSAFLIAAAVLAGGALLGWAAGRRDDAAPLDKAGQAH
jgi:DHA1 family tetracycline resistance protein-like MFS transporter